MWSEDLWWLGLCGSRTLPYTSCISTGFQLLTMSLILLPIHLIDKTAVHWHINQWFRTKRVYFLFTFNWNYVLNLSTVCHVIHTYRVVRWLDVQEMQISVAGWRMTLDLTMFSTIKLTTYAMNFPRQHLMALTASSTM